MMVPPPPPSDRREPHGYAKNQRVRESRPFGGGDAVDCLFSPIRGKYCHDGGIAFAHLLPRRGCCHRRFGAPSRAGKASQPSRGCCGPEGPQAGSRGHDGVHGPLSLSPENARFAHNGGIVFVPHHGRTSRAGVPAEGSAMGIMAPFLDPLKAFSLQGERSGSVNPPFWGRHGLVCLSHERMAALSTRRD
jgi:hypothetical protein